LQHWGKVKKFPPHRRNQKPFEKVYYGGVEITPAINSGRAKGSHSPKTMEIWEVFFKTFLGKKESFFSWKKTPKKKRKGTF